MHNRTSGGISGYTHLAIFGAPVKIIVVDNLLDIRGFGGGRKHISPSCCMDYVLNAFRCWHRLRLRFQKGNWAGHYLARLVVLVLAGRRFTLCREILGSRSPSRDPSSRVGYRLRPAFGCAPLTRNPSSRFAVTTNASRSNHFRHGCASRSRSRRLYRDLWPMRYVCRISSHSASTTIS